MSEQPVKVTVIIGSTRSGRFAPTVARWLVEQANARDDIAVDVVDLADIPVLTAFGSYGEGTAAEMAEVTPRLAAADAFVVVTPEYNHSYPAALKGAIDWHFDEWLAKPVAFVSYGGQSGGLRAVEHLRHVFAELHAVTIREGVSFHGASNQFTPDGAPKDPQGCGAAAQAMLARLVWWARALSEARTRRPYRV